MQENLQIVIFIFQVFCNIFNKESPINKENQIPEKKGNHYVKILHNDKM